MAATFVALGKGWGQAAPGSVEEALGKLLSSGVFGQQVANILNPQFGLVTGNEVVYYPDPEDTYATFDAYAAVSNDRRGTEWDLVFRGGSSGPGGTPASTTSTPNSTLIAPQLGLLEDDIVYRLAMLCVNVLQPLKSRYSNIIVISGFRQTNTGIGQHELAEAVDIQIQNQTPTLLFEVADYIQKFLPFDQLVLNFTNIGDGQPWIHVSFSVNSNRRSVQTKDFSDTFHEGLFLITPLQGEEEAAAVRDINDQTAAITTELQNIQTRQERLAPATANVDDLGGDGSGANAPDPPPGPIDHSGETFDAVSDVDAFDLSSVTGFTSRSQDALNAGLFGWAKTAKMLGGEITSSHTISDHSLIGTWGRLAYLDPTGKTGGTEGTLWLFVKVGDAWYGGVGENLRPGQIEKGFGKDPAIVGGGNMTGAYYSPTADDPLFGHVLQAGDQVGMMVTTPARNGGVISQSARQERSNIILVTYNG